MAGQGGIAKRDSSLQPLVLCGQRRMSIECGRLQSSLAHLLDERIIVPAPGLGFRVIKHPRTALRRVCIHIAPV
jgi:hypothetical protein